MSDTPAMQLPADITVEIRLRDSETRGQIWCAEIVGVNLGSSSCESLGMEGELLAFVEEALIDRMHRFLHLRELEKQDVG